MPIPGVSDQEQGNEETPAPGTQLAQDLPSFSGTATHTDKNEETVIASTKFIHLHNLPRLLITM